MARNIEKAGLTSRPAESCAHHIVALAHREAHRSRLRLFSWSIGINDADNGVFLPRNGVGLPGFPHAAHHTPFHSPDYHLAVWLRLRSVDGEQAGRVQLRAIKTRLLDGRMTV